MDHEVVEKGEAHERRRQHLSGIGAAARRGSPSLPLPAQAVGLKQPRLLGLPCILHPTIGQLLAMVCAQWGRAAGVLFHQANADWQARWGKDEV